jgi:hypothetical protein
VVPTEKLSVKRAKGLVPTHIKQVRTSAPKDMKAAKEQRAKGRVAAKERTKKRRELKSVGRSAGHRVIVTATPPTGRRT